METGFYQLVGIATGKEKMIGLYEVDQELKARQVFGIDAAPFERLLDLRDEKIKAKELDGAVLLGPYLKEISVVIDAVDGLEK